MHAVVVVTQPFWPPNQMLVSGRGAGYPVGDAARAERRRTAVSIYDDNQCEGESESEIPAAVAHISPSTSRVPMEGDRVRPQPQQRPGSERTRLGVYHDVLRRLRGAATPEALAPDFADRLWTHFHRFSVRCDYSRATSSSTSGSWNFCWSRIPFSSFFRGCGRYALDVNAERAEDVLVHMQLLDRAKHSENQPAFSVRVVQVRSD
jgi:hypothetical protein